MIAVILVTYLMGLVIFSLFQFAKEADQTIINKILNSLLLNILWFLIWIGIATYLLSKLYPCDC